MSRDCAYSDRNTEAGEKAVKKWSTGVKFCQRGIDGTAVSISWGIENPHFSQRTREMGHPPLGLTILYCGLMVAGAQ